MKLCQFASFYSLKQTNNDILINILAYIKRCEYDSRLSVVFSVLEGGAPEIARVQQVSCTEGGGAHLHVRLAAACRRAARARRQHRAP